GGLRAGDLSGGTRGGRVDEPAVVGDVRRPRASLCALRAGGGRTVRGSSALPGAASRAAEEAHGPLDRRRRVGGAAPGRRVLPARSHQRGRRGEPRGRRAGATSRIGAGAAGRGPGRRSEEGGGRGRREEGPGGSREGRPRQGRRGEEEGGRGGCKEGRGRGRLGCRRGRG